MHRGSYAHLPESPELASLTKQGLAVMDRMHARSAGQKAAGDAGQRDAWASSPVTPITLPSISRSVTPVGAADSKARVRSVNFSDTELKKIVCWMQDNYTSSKQLSARIWAERLIKDEDLRGRSPLAVVIGILEDKHVR